MRDEDELRAGLEDLADDYPVPEGLRERVERELATRHVRRRGTMFAAAAAVIAAALLAGLWASGNDGDRVRTGPASPGVTTSTTPLEPSTTTAAPTTTEATTTTGPVTTTTNPPSTTTIAPTTTTPYPEGKPECMANPNLDPADMDGDGIPDELTSAWTDQEGNIFREYREGADAVVAACLSAYDRIGTTVTIPGAIEAYDVVDIERDGKADLLVGGTTVFSSVQHVVREYGGSLVTLTENGNTFVVTDGRVETGPGDRTTLAESFGCVDRDGDGRRDLVKVWARAEANRVHWIATQFRITGATIAAVTDWSGDAGAQADPYEVARGVVPPCT